MRRLAASRYCVRRALVAPPPYVRYYASANTTLTKCQQFRTLAATFAAIEQSRSSRDKCVSLLAQALHGLLPISPADSTATDLAAALFLTASQLAPPYDGVELRFGTKSFVPVLQRLVIQDNANTIQWDQLLPTLPDYGAAVQLLWDIRITPPKALAPLSVAQVHAALVEMANEQGTGSTRRKQDRAVALLLQCQTIDEMVYLVRLLAHHKLRISMGEKSILAALALACLPTDDDAALDPNVHKAWTDAVATAYSQLPDYTALAAILTELIQTEVDVAVRTQQLLHIAVPRVGAPVLTMAAYPISSVQEALQRLRRSGETRATCEYKYDGARVQLHLSRGKVRRVFSRNMEDQTEKYGSLVDVLEQQLGRDISEVVLEGEVVAIDRATQALLPFQVLQTKSTTEFCLFAFDLLSLNGESLLECPLLERRRRLLTVLTPLEGYVQFVEAMDIHLTAEADEEVMQQANTRVRTFLEASVASGCEGLMVKTLTTNAAYRAGARSFSWVKLKHDYLSDETLQQDAFPTTNEQTAVTTNTNNGTFLPDTLDLVPIGAFYGKGRRAGVFGSFLLASVDAITGHFETIGKVGSGFSDAQLIQLSEQFRRDGGILHETGERTELPTGYIAATTAAQRPDVWLAPTQVWEIKATQLTLSPSYTAGYTQLNNGGGEEDDAATTGRRRKSKGLALRFPRFVRVRPEKAPEQATDSAQIATLFFQQGSTGAETIEEES